jgi:hypothetical protein
MTKAEQVRLVTWRSKILQHASGENRTVAQTCRFFGISRKTYYKWANRWLYSAKSQAAMGSSR